MKEKKIGTFFGVLVPNITMMLGVILFLRLGILIGHSSPFYMISVILISLAFMLVTSLSIASMATNMRLGGGGAYYLITRSLGIEIGGTIGLALFFSQLIGITVTVSGFAYTFCDWFPYFSVTSVEVACLLFLGLLSSASSKIALKFQAVILLILLLGVASVFFGSMDHVPPPLDIRPFYSWGKLNFWETFAFLFPVLTGIESTMSMSGILKKPGRSLYYGNIGALLFVASLYSALILFAYVNIPESYLAADPFIFLKFAWSEWLVFLGILTATLSSALGCILGAPRILQCMAQDGLAPQILTKVYGRYEEPRWALIFTLSLAILLAISTNIDQIIPMLTMICLMTYGLLNFVAGLNELMNTASWRPIVRIPWWLSIAGFATAILMMLCINILWTFITFTLFISFFLLLQSRNLKAGFQDLRTSMVFFFSRAALYHLGTPSDKALVWHPQLLVISTGILQREKLAHLSHQLAARSGLLTFAAIVPESWQDPEQLETTRQSMESYFEKEQIAGLAEVTAAATKLEGCLNLIRLYGMGAIQPNTIVLPLPKKNEWGSLFEIADTCRITRKNLVIFRATKTVDTSKYTNPDTLKKVDLWWNGDDRSGFDLAVSIASKLKDHKNWSQAQYTLRAIATSKSVKKIFQGFFQEFLKKSRLSFDPQIHEVPKKSDPLSSIAHYSKDTDLTIICLRGYSDDDTPKNYTIYLRNIFEQTKPLNDCLYITCYDNIEHREIYHHPGNENFT